MAKEEVQIISEQMQFRKDAEKIIQHKSHKIAIQGKVYTIHPISNKIDAKISALTYDALYYEKELSSERISRRNANRLVRISRQIPAKIAAYYKLGRLAHIPFVHSIYWRVLWHRSEEVSAIINSHEATGAYKDFFLANSEVIKFLLALSMRGVGESVKQMLERKESAESMLAEDALPKKEEGSK